MDRVAKNSGFNLLTELRACSSGLVNALRRRIAFRASFVAEAPKEELFDANVFRSRIRFRDNYHRIADALLDVLEFQSVLDLGCANGFLLEDFLTASKDVCGVELSSDAREVLPASLQSKVMIADAVTLGRVGQFDLVSCVEVAEHIPPESSTGLIDTIVANASRWIYFTAASPCQPGHGHINCRQQFYWLNEFRKRGVELDWERTERFVHAVRGLKPAEWLEWNSLILRVA